MNIEDAIRSRSSIRAFTDKPVSRETVTRILDMAQRAPSGTNTQPWHVHVAAGPVRDAITAEAYAMFQRGETDSYAEHDYYPDIWADTHRDRRRAVGWGLYGLLGIEKGDRDASMQQAARVSQRTAYFHLGKLIEVGETDVIFTNPSHKLTEDYITGRFG